MVDESVAPVVIPTRDGECRSFVFTPEGTGPWPAVIVYMDAFGVRPSLLDLGRAVAGLGYYVLVPDVFYRSGPYAVMDPKQVFASPDGFKVIKDEFMARADVANVMSDTRALLDFLANQPQVKAGPVGTTGYCMGGRFSLAAAGTFPRRVAAAASFHGGRLAADDAQSPHLLANAMKARVFVAGAADDKGFPDAMKADLEKALTDAGVEHTVETWPAGHGWTFYDMPVYDKACYERHLRVLNDLFGRSLGG
ncbi:MAG TPA: dienelactone hydrolase family protein [Rhodanobacteraceae bacterium]